MCVFVVCVCIFCCVCVFVVCVFVCVFVVCVFVVCVRVCVCVCGCVCGYVGACVCACVCAISIELMQCLHHQNGAFAVKFEGKSRKQDKVASMIELRECIADGWYELRPTAEIIAHRSHELAMQLRGCLVRMRCLFVCVCL